jgi:hypothetical protein
MSSVGIDAPPVTILIVVLLGIVVLSHIHELLVTVALGVILIHILVDSDTCSITDLFFIVDDPGGFFSAGFVHKLAGGVL